MSKVYVGRREVCRDAERNLLPSKLWVTVKDGDQERPLDVRYHPFGPGEWLDWRDNNKLNGPERLAALIVADLLGGRQPPDMVWALRDHFHAHGGTYWDGFALSEERVRELCKVGEAA